MAGSISAIVPTYRVRSDLPALIRSLPQERLAAGMLELLVVDNSEGGKATRDLAQKFPFVKVVAAERNLGYAGACNLGAKAAAGEILAFLNDDLRLGDGWFDEMEAALEDADCAGSLILDWSGRRVDFAGAAMNLFGYGISRHHGEKAKEYQNPPTYTSPAAGGGRRGGLDDSHQGGGEPGGELFASGAAMAVKRAVFEDAGGFDDEYFAYFEDVDFGWRLNLLGYRVAFQPRAVAYHRGGQTVKMLGDPAHHYYLQRNSLATIYKNYSTEWMAEVLQGATEAVLVKIRDLNRRGRKEIAGVFEKAARDFLEWQPRLNVRRNRVQLRRKKSDAEILPLFREPTHPAYFNEATKPLLEKAWGKVSAE